MRDFVMAFITALGVNVILLGVEIALGMEFSLTARMLIAVPAAVLIQICSE